MNRTIKVYPAFAGFFGMEETIERIVGFFRTPRRASKSASRSSICSARSAAASPRSPSG
jgi:predicted Ser/Thr protein kinase